MKNGRFLVKMYEFNEIQIKWLGHDGFRWDYKGKSIIIDPFKLTEQPEKANIVICSHEHFDHCSPDDLPKVVDDSTTVIAPHICKDTLNKVGVKKTTFLNPGEETEVEGIKFKAFPAYNLTKFRSPGQPFHPKESNHISVLVTFPNETTFYHTGDADVIPEMKTLGKVNVAFIPVSGTYVMTSEEALEAAKVINPDLAIPMHYGTIVGDESMAKKFAESATCTVEILDQE